MVPLRFLANDASCRIQAHVEAVGGRTERLGRNWEMVIEVFQVKAVGFGSGLTTRAMLFRADLSPPRSNKLLDVHGRS